MNFLKSVVAKAEDIAEDLGVPASVAEAAGDSIESALSKANPATLAAKMLDAKCDQLCDRILQPVEVAAAAALSEAGAALRAQTSHVGAVITASATEQLKASPVGPLIDDGALELFAASERGAAQTLFSSGVESALAGLDLNLSDVLSTIVQHVLGDIAKKLRDEASALLSGGASPSVEVDLAEIFSEWVTAASGFTATLASNVERTLASVVPDIVPRIIAGFFTHAAALLRADAPASFASPFVSIVFDAIDAGLVDAKHALCDAAGGAGGEAAELATQTVLDADAAPMALGRALLDLGLCGVNRDIVLEEAKVAGNEAMQAVITPSVDAVSAAFRALADLLEAVLLEALAALRAAGARFCDECAQGSPPTALDLRVPQTTMERWSAEASDLVRDEIATIRGAIDGTVGSAHAALVEAAVDAVFGLPPFALLTGGCIGAALRPPLVETATEATSAAAATATGAFTQFHDALPDVSQGAWLEAQVAALLPSVGEGGVEALHSAAAGVVSQSLDFSTCAASVLAPLDVAAAEEWLRSALEEHMCDLGPIKSVTIDEAGVMSVELQLAM